MTSARSDSSTGQDLEDLGLLFWMLERTSIMRG